MIAALGSSLLLVVTTASAAGGPADEALGNLSYRGVYDEPVGLTSGSYEGEPFVEGGAARPTVWLADLRARGDLSGDIADEVAVLLTESSGGSGSFTYLAIVADSQSGPVNVATIRLGDRVQIRTLRIENGYVLVDYVAAGPGEAACCPTLKVRKSFGLEGDQLVEAYSEELGQVSITDLEGVTWRLAGFDRHDPVPAGVDVTAVLTGRNLSGSGGCNRYFAAATSEGGRDLRIGTVGSTRMACPDPSMQAEQRYFAALENVRQFGFLMGQLALTYETAEGARALLFVAVD